ncbi:hypothetical protein [Agrobacterium pusense]|uniref:hypothetical protein n=1 Tax=Agrobacterium pusense TaxID=648995 RepID=UPI00244AB752|nr:hypothetical protein [Agrobacterium pusense]MDH0873385.1 hypothetical protein [Agrobacterium pusense]
MFDVSEDSATIAAFLIDPKECTVETVTMATERIEVDVNRTLECIFTVSDDLPEGFRIVSDKNAVLKGVLSFVEANGYNQIFVGKIILFSVDKAGRITSMTHTASEVSELFSVVLPVLDAVYEGGRAASENRIRLYGRPLGGLRVRLNRSRPLPK